MEPTFTLEQFLAVTNKLSIAELALTESKQDLDLCEQELSIKVDYVANLERKNSKLMEENIALNDQIATSHWIELERLLNGNPKNRIEVIRRYRELFGSGLKEAKNAVDDRFFDYNEETKCFDILKPTYGCD